MSAWREERLAAGELRLNVANSSPGHPPGGSAPREELISRSEMPTILFLHGVLRRWQTFAPLHAGLAHRCPLVGVDFPGHGQSDRWPGHYRVADYVAAAAAFVRENCPQPVVLYGHSLGAMVAAGVAAAVPDKVQAAILEDPPFDTMGCRIRQTPWHSYFTAVLALMTDASFAAATLAVKARLLSDVVTTDTATGRSQRLSDARDAASIRFLASCLARIDPAVLDPIVAGQWLDGFDWCTVVSRITAPVLLLQADPAAGGMLTDDDARAFVSAASDVTLVTLRGAGHNLHTARTQEVLNLVTQFLDSLQVGR